MESANIFMHNFEADAFLKVYFWMFKGIFLSRAAFKKIGMLDTLHVVLIFI